ncbi:signal peptidase I [Candidatus Bandiella euplotis]|uniref:Signal peptidase I n=1 Tax=Candidatus Bandiella euplotis TaxID=1664265 RepID=A0ABZ0UMJ1_9RICK|nr:signal peptidase I [Candidatus Bandiella woodruffii]WPX96466.1 Signal peptidase I [Candidatus Bandiella woodruffii]
MKTFFTYKKLKELFNSLIFAFVFAFLFQTFLYQPFKIPSRSMEPNLMIGDYLFVEKFAYGYSNSSLSFWLNRFDIFPQTFFYNKPKRGDVIVFLLPRDHSLHYIKRLIGLPGDEIQVKKGQLYINGVPTAIERIDTQKTADTDGRDIFQETLPNNISYKVYIARNSDKSTMPNDTPIYKVPQDHYFFMGDNRDNSIDSRYLNDVGFVPVGNVLGKAKFVYWSSDFSIWDMVTKFKTDRAFKLIN